MSRPKPIANVLSDLLAKRGYARVQAANSYADAWRQAAGDKWAKTTRPGQIKRGVLEVFCTSSILVQEMTFQKTSLLKKLAELLPDEKIKDIKIRVGSIE
jgi:predicted nucleic acid-binding Zn ribbon protein